jgi:nicotinamide-nucleotide amidase
MTEARAEIITIGDELLSGETVDTNSNWIDGALEAAGYAVERHTTVPDDLDEIADAFRTACARAELVISSGGLGPTQDDLTLEGLALALGCALRRDAPTIAAIAARFHKMGREMTPNNERQAMVPEVGEVIPNPVGTAPAFTAKLGRARVFLLPGVPREMRWLVEHEILPRVKLPEARVARRTLKVVGVGESRLEHSVLDVVRTHPEVRFGYRTLGAENHIKLSASGPDRVARLEAAEAAVRAALGDQIFGVDKDELSEVVGALLRERKQTLATAESCTGGWIGKLLTDVPGSSDYLLGGVVAYANAIKVELLGVRAEDLAAHGAVSPVVARAMAEGARARFGATFGLSTTGVAGPGGGTEEKPVGLVFVGCAGPDDTIVRELRLPGDRAQIRLSSALITLELLRRKIAGTTTG